MAYWYPTQGRVAQLAAELKQLEKLALVQASDASSYIPTISLCLASAQRTAGFPKRQIEQWIWIASQFRIYCGSNDQTAVVAGRALNFLGKRLNGTAITDEIIRELNWALESTVIELSGLLPPEALRSCLSAEELALVETHLAKYDPTIDFDEDKIRTLVKKQLSELEIVSNDGHLSTLAMKIETLFQACRRAGKDGAAARAALLYLAHESDAVEDTVGVLGLLDDVYVIEWAYAVVENNTRCLPLLHEMLSEWPFVADMAVIDEPLAPLDRFSQYVACASLHSLFVEDQPTVLVLRDPAPHGPICAFFAAVQGARTMNQERKSEVDTWSPGDHVTISDGESKFRAVYLGIMSVGNRQKYKIGVSKSASITVDLDVMPYISRSPTPHKRLSTGNEISSWLRVRHPDPFTNLTGTVRQSFEKQECVLLVGARQRVDEYLYCLKPFGSSVPALVGVNYISSDGRHHKLNGSTSDSPLIYVCSDAETAFDLIREPPEQVSRWRIVIEGARLGRAFQGIISTSGWTEKVPVCILSALQEREATADLLKQDLRVWYLEDQDVEVPPLTFKRTDRSADALLRALKRQANHWCVASEIHDGRNDFLEAIEECTHALASRSLEDYRWHSLGFSTSTFLQRAISQPFSTDKSAKALHDLARSIASQASVLRQYDPIAIRLYDLFTYFCATLPPVDRAQGLAAVLSTADPSERVAVICRSASIADACKEATQSGLLPCTVKWINLERLRQTASYDRVIVPGWLDRLTMRELFNCGYASRLELLLLPFERRWHEASRSASYRWERRLEARTIDTLRRVVSGKKAKRDLARLWRGQIEARLEAISHELGEHRSEVVDAPEFEQLDLRAIEALHQSIVHGKEGHPTARAQLVIFEAPGAYVYLPPSGKVIVLSAREGEFDESKLSGGGAERMLFRSVAALEPGMLLAIPLGNDRDLVDAKADKFMANPTEVRRVAAIWKDAIQRHLSASSNYTEFANRMAKAGQPRDPGTVKAWATQTQTVAPRNYMETVPLIAKLTGDPQLSANLPEIEQSIDLIYRARSAAAEAIVRELFTGSIDLDAEELTFDLSGKTVRYALHRVRTLEGIHTVPVDVMGRINFLRAVTLANDYSAGSAITA